MELVEEILTLKETSLYLKVSSESLRTLIKKRKIPAARVGNQWRFKKSLIDQWINEQCEYHTSPLEPTTQEVNVDIEPVVEDNQQEKEDFDEIL